MLFRLGKITDNTLSKIELYIEPNRHIGEVLIDNGLITKSQLLEALEFQRREITLSIFSAFDGEFSFDEMTAGEANQGQSNLDVNQLIADGIRRMDESPELEHFFSGMELTATERREELNLLLIQETRQFEAIKALELGYSVDPFPTESVYWKRLFLLYCLDLIKFCQPDESEDGRSDPDLSDLSVPNKNLLKQVLRLAAGLESMTYYELLDVSTWAQAEEVKQAYFAKARNFHPDLFDRQLPTNVKEKIQVVFDRINKAFRILYDTKARKQYNSTLDKSENEVRRGTLESAEQYFRKARTLYDQGQFKEAVTLFSHAVKLHPAKPSYVFSLARAQAEIPLYRKRAESGFLKAIQMEPWNPEIYLCLGQMYRGEGLTIKAEKLFRKALHIDPDNPEAENSLQLLEKERRKGGHGILSRKRKK